MSVALDERHDIGANGPPAEPFEAIKVHIEDLLLEAGNWADGVTVDSQDQVNKVGQLVDDLEKAAKAAEALRVEEKKPLDEAIAEIQARFNVYISDRKNKAPGKIWRAIDALKATCKPFLDKLERERQEAAAEARRIADAAAAEAAAAARAAQSNDLAAQDAAEELVQTAARAAAEARAIENSRVQMRGGDRAKGLRRTFTAVIADKRAAMLHYMAQRPEEFVALVQRLADQDVLSGKRQIPGFNVVEGTAL